MVDHIFDFRGHAAIIRGSDVFSSRTGELLYRRDGMALRTLTSGEVVGYLTSGQSPMFIKGAKDGLFP
jgi:hypothetical protein